MNSVERLIEYKPMATEAPAVIEDNRPAENWPSQGIIQLQNLEVRYRPELPPVISNLSFTTRAKEKVSHLLSSLNYFAGPQELLKNDGEDDQWR